MGRWGVLAILCLARGSMGLHLQAVAAVAPFLMADLGLGYGEIGTLIGIFLLPGALLALPGGLVSRRFGDTRALMGAMVLLAIGTSMLAASDRFSVAVVARLVSGAGGTLLTMQVAKMTTDWFAGRELSTAIGILLGTFPLGIAAVMAGLPLVATARSWREAVALIAASAIVTLLIVAALLRDPPAAQAGKSAAAGGSAPADRSATADGSSPAKRPRMWTITRQEVWLVLLSGAAFSLLNAGLIIFTSFTPSLLRQRGLGDVEAGILTSSASWVMIATLPLAGYFLDRARPVTAWLLASAALSTLVCLALPSFEPAGLWIVGFGIVFAPVVIGTMALPGEILQPESRATGFGLFFTTNYVGFAILPGVAGALVDLTGSTAAPIWFCGLIFATVVPLILWFRWLQRPMISATIQRGRSH
jgi:MFS family permease